MSSSDQAPPIRSFQFDTNDVANVRSSVNLFRADVNLNETLFTMPGRSADQGMDVDVSLQYQSNVYSNAMLWNRDAPTGGLGLGWELPNTAIELQNQDAPNVGGRRYAYVTNGSSNSLVRDPDRPFLFGMPGRLAAQLVVGESVPADIRSLFGRHGLCLSTEATVCAGASPTWEIDDPHEQQNFVLDLDGDDLRAFDGGEAFQLQSYQFWKILYYPDYERWLIVDENGLRKSFGGRVSTPEGAKVPTSEGNSIRWRVGWKDPQSDRPAWSGASGLTEGQTHYAIAWNLAVTSNFWGDRITYCYNEQWPVDPDTGLRPVVEQSVSAPDSATSGLGYTKACYLTSVTDVFGRRAVFFYADKLWDNSSPEAPREYADPHKRQPDTSPNAWQDCYETQYLAGIDVNTQEDATLLAINFEYNPRPGAEGQAAQVANVSTNTGAQYGDSFKRFLTGISFRNGDGVLAASMSFEYWLNNQEEAVPGASPGALRTATYPGGATASWSYTQQYLTNCDRSLTITPPGGTDPSYTPTVWFGPDYAVTLWYNGTATELTLQVHTWIGQWISWQLSESDATLFSNSAGFSPSTLNVLTNQDCLAVSFDVASEKQVYLFNKDVARPGQWSPAVLSGVVTGLNQPTLEYSTDVEQVSAPIGGRSFILVSRMDTTYGNYFIDRLTWRWSTGRWVLETSGEGKMPALGTYTWVGAVGDCYVTVGDDGTAQLYWLDDGEQTWHQGGQTDLPDINDPSPSSLVLVPGDGLIAVSYLRVLNSSTVAYTIYPLQWNSTYQLQSTSGWQFSDAQDPSGANPTSWIPQVSGNSLIACAGNLLRYNGQNWELNTSLALTSVPSGEQQRYAYGSDVAVQVLASNNGSGAASAKLLSYDANTDGTLWHDVAPASPTVGLHTPEYQAATANYPSCGDDYLAIGPWLYFRGTATNWSVVTAETPTSNLELEINETLGATESDRYVINSEALVNEAPEFLACNVFDTGESDAKITAVVLLENGQLSQSTVNPVSLPGDNQISVSSSPGSTAGGSSMFVTYPGSAGSFSEAPSFTLYQYVGNAIDGSVMHYAVTGFSADNGFDGPQTTAVVPDLETAISDSSGTLFKYYQCAVYPGATPNTDTNQPPQSAPFGCVRAQYINGVTDDTGDDYYNMLDGLLSQITVYDSADTLLTSTALSWKVWTERAPDPSNAGVAPVRLYGGFVCKTGIERMADGVTASATINSLGKDARGADFQAPWSSQPVARSITARQSAGAMETQTQSTLYGCERDPVLRALNVLSAAVMSTKSVAVENGPEIALSATAYSSTLWPTARGPEVLAPGLEGTYHWQGTNTLSYPFEGTHQITQPQGWLCQERITDRTLLGLEKEWSDPCGVVSSVLYAGAESLPVAQITNASSSADQWAFTDFDIPDQASPWTSSGTFVEEGDAYVGRSSLGLPDGASIGTSASPAGEKPYVLAYALKTNSDFVPDGDAGWTIEISMQDTPSQTQTVAFTSTDGVWTWHTVGIDLPANPDGSLRVSVTASNLASQTVWLDAVALVPLHSDLKVQCYDTMLRQPIAALSSAGRQSLTAYNRIGQQVASLGPEAQILSLTQDFLSPLGNIQAKFDPNSPGATLTVSCPSLSYMELFRSGNEWQSRWTALPVADWQVNRDTLCHTTTSSGNLDWNGWIGNEPPTTAAVFSELFAPQGLSGPLAWSFSGGYRLGWDPVAAGWFFEGPAGWSAPEPLSAPPQMPLQWLIVFGKASLLVFGDGQLTYSVDWIGGVPADLTLETGSQEIEVRNLAAIADPRLSLNYLDGSGATRQTQDLHGDDARLSQCIQDALGRTLATTKPAPARFGQDAMLPLMAYHSQLVDVTAFIAATADSWEMQGDVSDFYAGQIKDGVKRSDDLGYPYVGTRYEASPRHRVLEAGQPGRTLAIHDIVTLDESERLTTQYQYGNAGDASYLTRGKLDPQKTLTTQVSTVTRQNIAAQINDAAGNAVNQTRAQTAYQNVDPGPAGQQQTLSQPNFFNPPPQGGGDAFRNIVNSDALDQARTTDVPDGGDVALLYDPSGRIRFVQPALGPDETWFVYNKYDPLGRLVEEGLILEVWNPDTLANIALNDPDYPQADSGVSFTISRSQTYDGDGFQPRQIGMLTRSTTWSVAPLAEDAPWATIEHFTYDALGNTKLVELETSLPDVPKADIGYCYNALGEFTRVTFPQGAPLEHLDYTYDDLGQITRITTADSTELARYEYAISGAVALEHLSAGRMVQRYSFDSPGWLTEQNLAQEGTTNPVWSMQIAHDSVGRVRERSETLDLPDTNPENVDVTYEHDALGRLQKASTEGTDTQTWQATSYDANGNLWGTMVDDDAVTFTGASGSDQIASAQFGATPAIDIIYDARGQVSSVSDLSLTYDDALALPISFNRTTEAASIGIRLAYGGLNQRSVKQTNGTAGDYTRLYVCGTGTHPLALWQNGEWTSTVIAPTGLLALAQGDNGLGYALKDTQSSIRALVDVDGALLGRYRYGVFGTIDETNASPIARAMPWRFMGQEWDTEVGLYNFKARTYDPSLCRFLQPDPGAQFSSPYVFVGNDPVSMIDTDGQSAHWAQIGTVALVAAVTVAGMVLTPFTAGESDAAAVEVDADLVVLDSAEMAADSAELASGGLEGEAGSEVVESGVGGKSEASSSQKMSYAQMASKGSSGEGSSSGAGKREADTLSKREGGGDDGKRPPGGKKKQKIAYPQPGEEVRCRATGRGRRGQEVSRLGHSGRTLDNIQSIGYHANRGGRRQDNVAAGLHDILGRAAAGPNGQRSGYSCAEVNAVAQLLDRGVEHDSIRLGVPEVRRNGRWQPTVYCQSCRGWINALNLR